MKGNENLIDAIICLSKGYLAEDGMAVKKRNVAYNYLVCQSIQQYKALSYHYHVSVKTKEVWDKLTTQEIGKFSIVMKTPVISKNLQSPLRNTRVQAEMAK